MYRDGEELFGSQEVGITMKRNITALLVAAGFLTVSACATTTETKVKTEGEVTTIKETGAGPNVKTIVATGVITKYEPGNELEIKTADGNEVDFVLEDNVQITGDIAIGKTATVTYTDREGKKWVSIITSP
jgi:hypothetical protein